MGRSIKRAPFASTVSRPERRVAGRTWAPRTPLAVRTSGPAVTAALRDQVHRRLGLRLGKFAPHIERLTVRLEDVNGPKGGTDTACTIKVVVSGKPSIVVRELAGNAGQAFNRADDRVERAVRRAIGRAQDRGRLRGVKAPIKKVPRPSRATSSARPAAAPRNVRGRTRKATAAHEGSARARPSRKSTRGSVNRAKHGNKLARREQRRAASPTARHARAR